MKIITFKSVNVKWLSERTKIPEGRIKILLNPIVNNLIDIDTGKKASAIFKSMQENSESKYSIWYLWNALSKKELESVVTVKQAELAYFNSPPKSEACNLAMRKWIALSKSEVSKSSNLNEIISCYNQSLKDSESYYLALKKWIKTSVHMIKNSSDIRQAITAFSLCPKDSLTACDAFKKCILLSKNKDENDAIKSFAPSFSQSSSIAFKKNIKLTVNLKEAQLLYRNAPSLCSKLLAWEKWIQLSRDTCKSIKNCEDAKMVFEYSPCTSGYKLKALELWLKFSLSFDDVVEVFNNSLIGSKLESMALSSLIKMAF